MNTINNRLSLLERYWDYKEYDWFRAVIFKNKRIEKIQSILGTKPVKHSRDDGTPVLNDFNIGKRRYLYDMSNMMYYGRVPFGFFERDNSKQNDGPPDWVAPAILSTELDDLLKTAWIQPVFKGSGWIQKLLMSGKYGLLFGVLTFILLVMMAIGFI